MKQITEKDYINKLNCGYMLKYGEDRNKEKVQLCRLRSERKIQKKWKFWEHKIPSKDAHWQCQKCLVRKICTGEDYFLFGA